MTKRRSLLVPLDGSVFSELAIPVATRLALRDDATLTLVRAHETEMLDGGDASGLWDEWRRDETAQYLDTVLRHVTDAGLSAVSTATLATPIGAAICEYAVRIQSDLIVMATHGRTGFSRFWFGSVADSVVREATVPTLLVRAAPPPGGRDQPFRRVLVALDGSPDAARIVPHALALAAPDGAEFVFTRIVTPAYAPSPAFAGSTDGGPPDPEILEGEVFAARHDLTEIVGRVHHLAPSVVSDTVVVVDSHPASAILRVAKDRGIDLIAMTTHGRGGSRLVIGSIADKVLRGTAASLLLLRP